MPFSYPNFLFKKYISLPWEGKHTLPSSVASLPRFAPLLKNLGYATVKSDPDLRCIHVPLRGRKINMPPPPRFCPSKSQSVPARLPLFLCTLLYYTFLMYFIEVKDYAFYWLWLSLFEIFNWIFIWIKHNYLRIKERTMTGYSHIKQNAKTTWKLSQHNKHLA